ncbi:DUF1109 domain-containing protein [Azospira sp. APE16]|uniref:Probable anti-sigma-F factor NrsF n=1 Tax=Azospira oryzae (strain ATCC BAA-33 / DSM 13638 / PS) TaxID=640081 RepID=NRSF_AZOOP|nr:DUF1109 domain-containing protein [Azospira oryzae]G8QM60.1 RecName: Full=Probable anti-sigma-F factor NrsF; AltName: Full=Negative regulator of sigma F; AltName: Full=Regulator of SigF; AltName: Full=Sigma-F anti-sigma factor NrsF [Azospira oryzae PS]AEV24576.1 hypothetical protein Dsui_0154 [Azospira oryzae PS]
MKTEDLITMLAAGAGAVEAPSAAQRYALAIGWGAAGATLLMLALLQVRHDLGLALLLPMFWVKVGFVTCLAAGSLFAVLRLSRPGAKTNWVPAALGLPVLGMWAIAAFTLIEAEPMERSNLFFGDTWKSCPLLIAMLSVPVFAAVLRSMKDLAPTRPRLAGFAAGLLAGAVAAVVYCLHCPELGAPFIGFWYLLGMLIPAAVGVLLGNSMLRW